MDKYINAEQLKQAVETSMDMQDLYLPSHFFDVIDGVPAADVVEVVRCKDCKYASLCFSDVEMTNRSQTKKIYKQIEWCSYGERKDG